MTVHIPEHWLWFAAGFGAFPLFVLSIMLMWAFVDPK